MKKYYVAPEVEFEELEMEDTILAGSAEESQGGGIDDDYSSDVNPNPSEDPDKDFGW